MSTVKNPTKVITGKHTVMSYLNVNEPKTPLGGGTPKYSPRSALRSRRLTTRARASSKAAASSYRRWRTSRLRCVMATRSARATKPMQAVTS